MDDVIEQGDGSIDFLSDFSQKISRDQAVAETQAWSIAFKEEGKEFIRNYVTQTQTQPTSMLDYVALLSRAFPFQFRRDPIPSWRKRAGPIVIG